MRVRPSTSMRRLKVGLAVAAVALLTTVLAVGAGAIDTTSTAGVRVVHVPDGDSASGVAMVGDAIALNQPTIQPLSGLWPGVGPIIRLKDDFPFGAFNIEIEDMNANLEVVGSYRLNGVQVAFKWSESGGAIDLPQPPNFVANSTFEATGISDDGWIVGRYRATAGTCYSSENTCGFLAVPNGATYDVSFFQQPSRFATFLVNDIELATIDGVSQHIAVGTGLVWTDANGFFFLDAGTTVFAEGRDVNRSGEIVGNTSTGSVLEPAYWASPTAPLTPLGHLTPGDDYSLAHAINDAGTVVGQSGISFNQGTAFVWDSANGLRDLGHIAPGTAFSAARGINEDGIITGESAGDAVIWDLDGDYDIGSPTGPVMIQVNESIGVADGPSFSRPGVIEVLESIAVSDEVSVRGPISIAIAEEVTVSDGPRVNPSALIRLAEQVSVTDSVTIATQDPGAITGLKWEDGDGDAIRDADEPAIEGVTIYLDLDDDATLDGNEPSTTTDANGAYEFADLGPGLWVVRELVPPGYAQTFPLADDEGEHRVDLPAGGIVTDLDFGNRPTPNLPPVIQPINDVVLDVGDSIEIPVTITDPEGDLFTKNVEGLPRGVINGVIPYEPLPEEAGMVFTVTVTAVQDDNPDNFDTETFTVTVNPLNQPPEIEPIEDVAVDVGDSIEIPVVVNDPEGDPFTKSVEGLPRGVINGVIPFEPLPEEAGMVFTVTVTAVQNDNPDNFDTETFTVTVTDRPPEIEPIDDVVGLVGSEIVVEPDITDPEGDEFDITWEGSPPNGLVNGIFVLTPTEDQAESIFEITVIATEIDNPTNSASETFNVLVAGVPEGPTDPLDVDPVSGPGDDIEIEGGGFLPGSDVKVYFLSDPVLLGTVTVGPDGAFSASLSLPDEASDGPHQIVVVGLAQDGNLRTLSSDIDVVRDSDDDGLRDTEEALTGTDPDDADSDGDGLVDGIDASWLIDYLDELDSGDFKRRWHRGAMKLTVGAAALAVNLGEGDLALAILDSLDRRVDGCGSTADRSDWIVDCLSQTQFRDLLELYRRGIETLPLPDPFPWW